MGAVVAALLDRVEPLLEPFAGVPHLLGWGVLLWQLQEAQHLKRCGDRMDEIPASTGYVTAWPEG